MKKFLMSVFFLLLASSAYADAIDLRTWSQQGASGNGNWVVADDGSSVQQTLNGDPTYFVSDTDYINKKFEGSFYVNDNDDDYIGFVFGWNGTDDYLLFDWKQGNQSYKGDAYEGFTLSRISGSAVNLWDHTGSDIQVLASDYGDTKGWAKGTTYTFVLDYTTSDITISINATTIFNISDTDAFSTGKFGFYNYSQDNVTYQGFEEVQSPNAPVPEPATMVLFGIGLLGLAGVVSRKKK